MGDVVRSVAVLTVIVLGLWAFGQFKTSTPADPVGEVDWQGTAASARQAATYPLLAPTELPDGWRSNGVRFTPGVGQEWHLGVLTDDDRYIGLEQAKVTLADLIKTHVEGARPDGTVEIAGTTWQRYVGPNDKLTLTQESPEVSTLVTTTTAPFDDVKRFVESLAAE